MSDTEVNIEVTGFSVTIKGDCTVDHAVDHATKIFEKFAPKEPAKPGPAGFALVERRGTPEAQPSSMRDVPRDFPERRDW